MRDFRFLVYPVMLISGLLWLNANALAYDHPRSSIRINLGGWDMPDGEFGVVVDHGYLDDDRLTDVWVSGMSAGFAFSHMVNRSLAWEISVGGFSDGGTRTHDVYYRGYYYEGTYFDSRVVSVSYLAVGMMYYPLSQLGRIGPSALRDVSPFFRPYLTAGVGRYLGWDVRWDTRPGDDDVTDADLTTDIGTYYGVGIDLPLSRHFIFNIDLRYHFVEFDEPLKGVTDYSGSNVLAGFKIAF